MAAGACARRIPWAGETLEGAKAWAATALGRQDPALGRALTAPDYALPSHPPDEGGHFEADAPALAELARWYADLALRGFAARTEGAGEVLTWPHHFDIATLVTVARDADGEASETLGLGLSPGDDYVAVPYWYVNHWPGPRRRGPGNPGRGPLAHRRMDGCRAAGRRAGRRGRRGGSGGSARGLPRLRRGRQPEAARLTAILGEPPRSAPGLRGAGGN